jgi:hypothetical protein
MVPLEMQQVTCWAVLPTWVVPKPKPACLPAQVSCAHRYSLVPVALAHVN